METTTLVTLRTHGTTLEVIEVNDKYVNEALDFARKLKDQNDTFDKALIDRFDGLVLIGAHGTYRFTTPLCGYAGTGPRTSAQILEMFEFDSVDSLMERISGSEAVEIYR